MAIKLEKLIDLLNMDLELEYSAAIQYINHAAVMTGAAYGDIIKKLSGKPQTRITRKENETCQVM